MNQLYYKILSLCLLVFSIGNISAQECSSNFTVNTVPTASTCQSNGTITVTLGGDVTNLFNIQYGLTSSSGFTINPQDNNVLSNIPAGTYTVSVRAFCSVNASYDVVKTVANVRVLGNYVVPSVSFNATVSRKSYDICNTGIIALNVTDGSGNFTFNITSAPAGVTTGLVVPTKVGTVYTFPTQDYPAGNYAVQIQDGCYSAVATFTLGQVTGFPTYYYTSYALFRPTFLDNNCGTVNLYVASVNSSNPDYDRYYRDGMYQVGVARAASTPTAWTDWIEDNLIDNMLTVSIAPNNYSDFYVGNSISVFTRLKGCSTGYTSITSYMRRPSMYNTISRRDCNNYQYNIKPWSDYDGMVCYPVSILVTKTSDGSPVYTNPSWSYNSDGQPVTLDYDTHYSIRITDLNGTVLSTTANINRNLIIASNVINCDNYQLQYAVPSGNTCWPVRITITDASNNVVCTDSIVDNNYHLSCPLNFGQTYTAKALYVNSSPQYTHTFTTNVASSLPTAYTLTLSSYEKCVEDLGYLNVTRSGAGVFPVGTVMTITGPPGFTTQTIETTYSSTSANTNYTYLPAGTYTATINHGCGTPITVTAELNGAYSGRNLTYTSQTTCEGLQVTPSGLMTFQGNPITTYYRLTSGPSGYDRTVISPGGSLTLSTPGTYVLGILNTNNADYCTIKELTINYTAPPLALDQTATNAYECVDDVTGIILLKAINGVAPYTYQLWDKTNTIKLPLADIVSSGQVHFTYGQADSTYTVRIIDKCDNSFDQKITLAKLSTARIVYSPTPKVCYGDTIRLQCITLGNTAYNWTGPNGYTSPNQNPKRANALPSMTGWYKVSVLPEFCGNPVQDSVYIQVYAPLAAGAVTGTQEICVRKVANALSCTITGGSGIYTYQWQSSTNGTSGWSNIPAATNVLYTPPAQIRSGVNYYRVIATDTCGTVTSNVITVTVKGCYVLVNPNIRARSGQ